MARNPSVIIELIVGNSTATARLLKAISNPVYNPQKFQAPKPPKGSEDSPCSQLACSNHVGWSVRPPARYVCRARIDVRPIEKNGSAFVPNASGYRISDFRQMGGPSVRVVIDVGNWDNSRAVNHPGQSGDPGSPHYRDLAQMWRNGQYFPLLYSRKTVENATEKRINLEPEHAQP